MTGVFTRTFDAVGAPAPLRRLVLDELRSPRRDWHGTLHHALMLRHLARGAPSPATHHRLIWATLFHDIVYDATRSDNEEASAAVARSWLEPSLAEPVARLILATKHHDLATDPETRALLEADLAVLWTPSRPLYAFYAAGVRAEYSHVPDNLYRAGRGAVMSRLRDAVLPHLDPRRAALLRRNVDGELARLGVCDS